MARLKSIWPAVSEMHVRTRWSGDSLWARRVLLYQRAAQQSEHIPMAFAGATPCRQLSERERFSGILAVTPSLGGFCWTRS
jgi:hypothetical protein